MKSKISIIILAIISIIYFSEISLSDNILLKQNKNFSPWIASIKTSKANLRTGPGKIYPIKWVYTKKRWPLKITAQLYHWRKVQTVNNIKGWFHKSQLSSKKTTMVMVTDYLRNKPNKSEKKLAILKKKLIVDIIKCKVSWCKIQTKERRYSGWFIKNYLWGTDFVKVEK